MTYRVTYYVRPHQPIIDQQGLGLRGLIHKVSNCSSKATHIKVTERQKEAHPVIPDLH